MAVIMGGVREYAEGFAVELADESGRAVVVAKNEGGYNCTQVDVADLVAWFRAHRPDLLAEGGG